MSDVQPDRLPARRARGKHAPWLPFRNPRSAYQIAQANRHSFPDRAADSDKSTYQGTCHHSPDSITDGDGRAYQGTCSHPFATGGLGDWQDCAGLCAPGFGRKRDQAWRVQGTSCVTQLLGGMVRFLPDRVSRYAGGL